MPVDSADTCRAGRESRGDAGVAGLERSLAGNVTDSAASIDAVAAIAASSAADGAAAGDGGAIVARSGTASRGTASSRTAASPSFDDVDATMWAAQAEEEPEGEVTEGR